MKNTLTIFLTLFFTAIAYTQNFRTVDSMVNNYPETFDSLKKFADRVAGDFELDIDRTRAVYYWISNNIAYNYEALDQNINGYSSIPYNSELEYKNKLLTMQKNYAEVCMILKKGVCEGYSQLLKFVLLDMGIESEVISGFAKSTSDEIGKIPRASNHAWNAVKINDQWKFLDATWSTGNERGKPGVFNFTDTYFFIPPQQLILTHYPKNPKWQMLDPIVAKSEFASQPIFFEKYLRSGLVVNPKTKGVIKVKYKGNIVIEFDQVKDAKGFYYAFTNDNYASPIVFRNTGDKYVVSIPYNAVKSSSLTLYQNEEGIMEFKIIPVR